MDHGIDQIPMTEELANKCFNVLMSLCGVRDDPEGWNRRQFVYTQTKKIFIENNGRVYADHWCREYRFGGKLGYGGKFWNNNNRLYVNCYKEDENLERKRRMDLANEALQDLYTNEKKKSA